MSIIPSDNNNRLTVITPTQDLRQVMNQFPRYLPSFNQYVETVSILDLNRQLNALQIQDIHELDDLINRHREDLNQRSFDKLTQIISQRKFLYETEEAKIKEKTEPLQQKVSRNQLKKENDQLKETNEGLRKENEKLKKIGIGFLGAFAVYSQMTIKKDSANQSSPPQYRPVIPNVDPTPYLEADQLLIDEFEQRVEELSKENSQLHVNVQILEKRMLTLEEKNHQFKNGLFWGGVASGILFIAIAGRKTINADAAKKGLASSAAFFKENRIRSIGGYEALQFMKNKSHSILENWNKFFKSQSQKKQ